MVRPLRGLALLVASLIAGAGLARADDSWTLETVADGLLVPHCSLALDTSGAPRVAFNSGGQPRYGYRDGGLWASEPLSTPLGAPFAAGADIIASPAVIFFVVPSLAFDPAGGEPRIAYCKMDQSDVWYAEHSPGGWSYELLGTSGQPPSLAIDAQGRAHVAYTDNLTGPVYSVRNGSTWTSEPIPGGAYVSGLRIDATGHPHVTMTLAGPNADLLHAERGESGWTVESVDTTGNVGAFASLTLDQAGEPHITYIDQTQHALRYAVRSAGDWTIETVSLLPGAAQSSIAIAPDGQPFVAYHDAQGGDLLFARREAGSWNSVTVDAAGSVGEYCSLAIDALGRPHVAYFDGSQNFRVRYATRSSLVTGVGPGGAVSGFGIDRLAPNPAPAGASIELTLRAAEPGVAALELVDLSGRIVARHDVALAAGLPTLRWDPGVRSAGLYFLRVRFGFGRSAVARLAVLR